MTQLAGFLDKYDTLIFDLDGVITCEQHYWTAAALTVWEVLHSADYFGTQKLDAAQMSKTSAEIRKQVFCADRTITLLKKKGVNNNWDLGYVVFACAKILGTEDFEAIYSYAQGFSDDILEVYDLIGKKLSEVMPGVDTKRNGELWTRMQMCFQEWFLGEENFKKQFGRNPILKGKGGLCYSEEPLIDGEKLKTIFDLLKKENKRLCIGTGRPKLEMEIPMESFGIMPQLDQKGIVHYDHVQTTEARTGVNVTKPHPFVFLKAFYGVDYPEEKILEEAKAPKRHENVLVIGDAGADILAAQAAGMDFCAVLTGVSGQEARGYFEETGADYILDSLENFLVE
ncbi:MAG: hypothetical protein E7397_07200 [Ruminococcaceae bacterium]|nr:hypothetical protein [Oscillospiraceae bacterium]